MKPAIPKFLSGISIRLLAFNMLIVFLPVAAFLYLDTYERQLLQGLEHALVQQGRVFAAALSAESSLRVEGSEELIGRMERRLEARIRIIGTDGSLIADSSLLGPKAAPAEPAPPLDENLARSGSSLRTPAEDRILYQVASRPITALIRIFEPPSQPIESAEFYVGAERILGEEVLSALAGRYGAATRISSGGQRSVTLYSAIPIRHGDDVIGAVLVSQSTYRILRDLYELRLDVFQIFLISVAAAVVLSSVASLTISVPLRRLNRRARELLDHRGRLLASLQSLKNRDEIGDLSRSLGEMTQKLRGHLDFVETFAADVTHEFKNPLASIRTAAEMTADSTDPEARKRFSSIILREVGRMQRLLSAVKDLSLLDAGLDEEARASVDLCEVLEQAVRGIGEMSQNRCSVRFHHPHAEVLVHAAADRLYQVFHNIIENAAGIATEVEISIVERDGHVDVEFADDGPGIHEGHIDRVFDRFFSYRPADGDHMGLGLSIVKAIVEGYGGTVTAENIEDGGARFVVALPLSATSTQK